jgi:hypothetical protein
MLFIATALTGLALLFSKNERLEEAQGLGKVM